MTQDNRIQIPVPIATPVRNSFMAAMVVTPIAAPKRYSSAAKLSANRKPANTAPQLIAGM